MAALEAVAGAAPAATEPSDDLTADHVRTLYEQTPVTLASHAVVLAVITLMFHAVAPGRLLWPWAGAVAVLLALRVWCWSAFPRGDAVPVARLLAWRARWNAVALATAVGWGSAAWLFYRDGTHFHLVALIVIVYSYMLGGVQFFASQPRVYLAFVCLGMLPIIARIATDGHEPFHLELAGILLLLFGLTVMLSAMYRRAFESTLELKVATERMARQLKLEKAAADAARRAAEVANRAKTQFFAAASHDLRQPLHALGLFAEALRARSHDEQAVQLVNSINHSVDALEGLFGELLDITKIDSGGVEPQPAHFAAGGLFRKLRLHFEPIAFEKGLALRFRGGAHAIYADPVLVERIARNLLSNAIRYTEDGGVLVCCRRRGERVLLQVWDTGVGLAPREQERVFDEFYQVVPGAALEPHQRKGLGLGLAIVKRLAALIDAPLALRSDAGRGSVFTLELPLGRVVPQPAELPPARQVLGLRLERRLVLVVEDEPSVRAGLEVLLKSWGASVVSFDSVARCADWLRQSADGAKPPDLLIADYRMESGRTGVEAIRAVRARFGDRVPAIIVTGSTMTAHEGEAQAADFHVLIKPVVPSKLRAMIAFKLGVR